MKPIKILLIGTCSILLAGCQTAGVYDPVKTAQVEEAIRPVTAAAVRGAVLSHPQYIPYVKAIGVVFCKIEAGGNFTPTYVLEEVNKLIPPSKDPVLLAARDLLTSSYGFYFNKQVVDLDQSKWPAHLAKILCEGINTGLAGIE